jgi:hypothetical protein
MTSTAAKYLINGAVNGLHMIVRTNNTLHGSGGAATAVGGARAHAARRTSSTSAR